MDTIQTEKPMQSKGGSSLAIIIIILIIALGGAYFWYTKINATRVAEKNDAKALSVKSDTELQKSFDDMGEIDVSQDLGGLDKIYK